MGALESDLTDLYVITPLSILRLDLKNNHSDPQLLDSSDPPPPAAAVCLIYGETYPSGMGVVKSSSRSKIYLLGGENSRANCLYPRVTIFRRNRIYEFNPVANSLQEANFSLRAPKRWPIVREIDGKIYALEGSATLSRREQGETFEVIDPSSSDEDSICSKVLDNPPFYTSGSKKDNPACDFVLGHKLYIMSSSGKLYYYDTKRRSWGIKEDMFKYFCKNVYSCCRWLLPEGGTTVCGGDVILAFKEQEGGPNYYDDIVKRMELYGYLYSKDGCLLGYQNLGNVFSVTLYSRKFHVFAMEDGRVCALLAGTNHEIPALLESCMIESSPTPVEFPITVIAVSIFRVVKLRDAADALQHKAPCMPHPHDHHLLADERPNESTFLSLEIEKQYIFRAGESLGPCIRGAFFFP